MEAEGKVADISKLNWTRAVESDRDLDVRRRDVNRKDVTRKEDGRGGGGRTSRTWSVRGGRGGQGVRKGKVRVDDKGN